jgi:hypothetical protein
MCRNVLVLTTCYFLKLQHILIALKCIEENSSTFLKEIHIFLVGIKIKIKNMSSEVDLRKVSEKLRRGNSE